MPRYDYRCQACGHVFELRQSFNDPPVAPCPQCNETSERILHAPQVLYKGSGFYTSDNRRNGFGSYWYNRDAESDRTGRDPSLGADSPAPSE